MNENYMPGLEFDPDVAAQQADQITTSLEENAKANEAAQQMQQQREKDDAAEAAQLNDPRSDGVGFNVPDIATELGSALGGGLQDTGSSIVSIPERAIDMFNGEMAEEGENYKPEWDPLGADGENLIETKTWWGGLIRGTVHFGSMALATVGAAKVAALLGAGAGATWLAGGATTTLGKFGAASTVGAISDLGSKYSQDDNALGTLTKHYGFIDTPITTKDTDHPAMMTLKNVVEGMGIGAVFEGVGMLIKKGTKARVKDSKGKVKEVPAEEVQAKAAQERAQSVTEQIDTRGKEQFNEEGFGGYKNKPVADPWQGAPTSTGKADEAWEQLGRIRNEWGADNGSTKSVTTPAELNRYVQSSDLPEEIIEKTAKSLMSSEKFKEGMRQIKAGKTTMKELWGEQIGMYKEIVEGRNTSDMSTEEFMKPFMEGSFEKNGQRIMSTEKVAAADLVIGSLVREARDLGMVGRELGDIADLGAKDGPGEQLVDKIVTLLAETKRARFDAGRTLKNLDAGNPRKPSADVVKEGKKVLKELKRESKEALFAMLRFADGETSDDMMKGIFEYISQSKDLTNYEDLAAWAKKKLKGGEFSNGRKETGALINELGKVMVHSVLSGPKTPVRAIMGTSSAAFLRPMSMALGATLNGDSATRKASLANLAAMVEMVPEAFKLFMSKLNSSFAGDIATPNQRYIDDSLNKSSVEWEIMSKYYNGPEATKFEKQLWGFANLTRNLNDKKFLTYSTKLMRATDETFKVLMARGVGRERAMRASLDGSAQINPKQMKEYEQLFSNQILDADGTVRDDALKYGIEEITLTKQLDGFSSRLDKAFQATPWAKPFFLFARTSVNGLELVGKHTPVLNRIIVENQAIRKATPETLDTVAKYGIKNADELANAKALANGREAIGSAVTLMASIAAVSGNIRGNGPMNEQLRQTWVDAKWRPNEIKIGDVWVNFEAFEPFNVMLTTIGDIATHSQMMGEEWTEEKFQQYALIVAESATSKSYLQGLQLFVDVLRGDPKALPRIAAGLANNQIPMSSLRNELGKILNPGMKELSSSIWDQIRNRNQGTELLAAQPLPAKYDLLNGEPIKDWDLPTSLFNAVSPVQFNLDDSPGRELLFNSQYDMRLSVMSAPSNPPISLRENNVLRSAFAEAIGKQNLELELNKLARRTDVQDSVKRMKGYVGQGGGSAQGDPMDLLHNRLIKNKFDAARKKAWATVASDPRFVEMIEEERTRARIKYNTRNDNFSGRREAVDALNMKNK
jgi:hypothetical protein|tara:strand:+ start:1040 stop:4807 length:3768 start_codon:yes stop_codon:yes gene_type:complete